MNSQTRKSRKWLSGRPAALLFFLAALPAACVAQAAQPSPPAGADEREQLLNGLSIVLVERPGEAQAVLRLRVHNGAAFDLAGKDGLMALLGDALFPDAQTREYVSGDLEGRLSVSVGHDSLDVLLAGRADQFERLVELLRNAVVNTQLTPEVFGRVRDARLKIVRELGVSPGAAADDAISSRLYGTYPYGRRVSGTPESLARITLGDLVAARERFLNPNSAMLVVTGGFERRRALRALRQFLGVWRKGEQVSPTFRQPEPVDARPLVVDFPGLPDAEVRVAVRGLARSERDAAAAAVLAELARTRWLAAAPELKGRAVTVRHDARALGGTFLLGASVPTTAAAATALEAARKVLESLAAAPAAAEELEAAKKSAVAVINKQAEGGVQPADSILDSRTYGTAQASSSEMARAAAALTAADVQRVAAKLFRAEAASVVVGDAARLRADLARLGEVEVAGDAPSRPAPKPAQPTPFKAPAPRRP